MFTDKQVAEFKERGFIHGPRVYSDAEADRLKERMFAVLEGRTGRDPAMKRNLLQDSQDDAIKDRVVYQIVNTWESDDLFREHLYHPGICAGIAELFGHPVVRVWHDQVQFKPPRIGGPTDWHQDHPYWQIIQPPDLISAWVALDDATVENGCMSMVPGSHKWGPYRQGTIGTNREDFSPAPDLSELPEGIHVEVVPCEVKKGHVLFHHCMTWHGSPNNTSDKGRPAIAVHYMPGYTRFEPVGNHPLANTITVAPGEILTGEHFPTVWDNGPVAH